MESIGEFFIEIESLAETIMNGAKHIGKRISNGLDTFKELAISCEELFELTPIPKDSPLYNEHPNALAADWIKDSFRDGDVEIIDWYLEGVMLKPNHERRHALWKILDQSERWKEINPDGLPKYLHVAVKNEAKRQKRDRDKKDRLWGKFDVCYMDDINLKVFESSRILTPEAAILRDEELQIRLQIIRDYLDECIPREREIIRLHFSGFTLTEAVRAIGAEKYHYQALQRKLNRRLKKYYKKYLLS